MLKLLTELPGKLRGINPWYLLLYKFSDELVLQLLILKHVSSEKKSDLRKCERSFMKYSLGKKAHEKLFIVNM